MQSLHLFPPSNSSAPRGLVCPSVPGPYVAIMWRKNVSPLQGKTLFANSQASMNGTRQVVMGFVQGLGGNEVSTVLSCS